MPRGAPPPREVAARSHGDAQKEEARPQGGRERKREGVSLGCWLWGLKRTVQVRFPVEAPKAGRSSLPVPKEGQASSCVHSPRHPSLGPPQASLQSLPPACTSSSAPARCTSVTFPSPGSELLPRGDQVTPISASPAQRPRPGFKSHSVNISRIPFLGCLWLFSLEHCFNVSVLTEDTVSNYFLK